VAYAEVGGSIYWRRLMGTGKKCLALHALWSPSCCNIAITLIFGWGTYLQPHFGHLVGGAFAVLLLIVNLRTFVSSDS
jgi:hypothetical protein